MFKIAAIFGLIGLALATALIVWSGFDQVVAALNVAGWGIVWTSLFHLVSMFFAVLGWQVLLGGKRPSKMDFFYVLWIRAAINNLMPVARIGGEIVSVRLLTKMGLRRSLAIACTVIETSLSVVAVFIVSIVGVVLFAARISDAALEGRLLLGLLLTIPLLVGLFVIQKIGAFTLLMKIFSLLFKNLRTQFEGSVKHFDRTVRQMYRRKGRILACLIWELAAWVAGTGEIWLALTFLGHPLTPIECFMIEALIQAAASAAFVVPGAVGVQEAGFMFFGHLLGLTPDVAAALAIIRRCRDLLLYVPGLIVWQIQEGKSLFAKKSSRQG